MDFQPDFYAYIALAGVIIVSVFLTMLVDKVDSRFDRRVPHRAPQAH